MQRARRPERRGHGELGTFGVLRRQSGWDSEFRRGNAMENAGSCGEWARICRAFELFAAAIVSQDSAVCSLQLCGSAADAGESGSGRLHNAGEAVEPAILDTVG